MPIPQALLDDLWRLAQKADQLHQCLSTLPSGSSQGAKPFFSNIRTMAERGHDLLILGINPGGNNTRQNIENDFGILGKLGDIDGQPVSAFLDEEGIPPDNPSYRSYVLELATHLPKKYQDLRQLPFANICPLRTPGTKGDDMHSQVWLEGQAWGLELIKCLRPRLLLCLGNGDNRSAWGALRTLKYEKNEKFSFRLSPDITQEDIHGGTRAWKKGFLKWNDNSTTEVLALSHPRCNLATRNFEALNDWLGRPKHGSS